jgi:hypothetical protein
MATMVHFSRKSLVKFALWFVFLVLVLFFVQIRLFEYGRVTDSVGVDDTLSYLSASKIRFPSLDFFTSSRSATLPLLYKIFRPPGDYQLLHLSRPAISGSQMRPEEMPSFERIIIFQIIVAISCWVGLALALFRHLVHPVAKILSVVLVLLFGLSPQMADWDQILLTESLSFSLFALLIALVIELAFSLRSEKPAWVPYIWVGLLSIVMVIWVFLRDTNSYLVLLSIFSVALLVLFAFWRKVIDPMPLVVLLVAGIVLFGFHQATFRASDRWKLPLLNNLIYNVFPFPSRVEFFEVRGMPVSPELLKIDTYANESDIYEREAFMAWVQQRGLSSYTEFLIHSPLWALLSVYHDIDILFSENTQPYFKVNPADNLFEEIPLKTAKRPWWLLIIGNSLHAVSSVVLWMTAILTLMMVAMAYRQRTTAAIIWAILACWVFLGGVILLATGYLGEVRSIIRHAMAGVVPLRLALWLLSAILIDLILTGGQNDQPAKHSSEGDGVG